LKTLSALRKRRS